MPVVNLLISTLKACRPATRECAPKQHTCDLSYSAYMCAYVYVHVCVHACVHMRVCMCVYVYVHACMHVYVCLHVCVCVYAPTTFSPTGPYVATPIITKHTYGGQQGSNQQLHSFCGCRCKVKVT